MFGNDEVDVWGHTRTDRIKIDMAAYGGTSEPILTMADYEAMEEGRKRSFEVEPSTSSSSSSTAGNGSLGFVLILAMIFGAYDNIYNGNGPINSATKAGGLTFEVMSTIGDKIRDIDPNSTITSIGNQLFKVIGVGCGITAGFGAGIGNGMVWVFRGGESTKMLKADAIGIKNTTDKSQGNLESTSSEVFTGNAIIVDTQKLNIRSCLEKEFHRS
ncbi:MAG: hypothetical protein H6973_19270 [Gammaproteobacteria bacterium]|nr:hypothetical protein [Gammaproteobacteria bacterium]